MHPARQGTRRRLISWRNIRVVGYSETNGRPGFKLAIQQIGGRWLLYMGHLWDRGWSIMDVTDPHEPQVLKFIPGPTNTWTIQMEIEEGKMITALERIAPGWGGDPTKPFDEGVLIWSLADPLNPNLLGHYFTGGSGTHRDGYFGGKYVHLAAGMPGIQRQHLRDHRHQRSGAPGRGGPLVGARPVDGGGSGGRR